MLSTQAIFYIARELYVMYYADGPHLDLAHTTKSASPYVHLAALVAMSMKLAYGIGSVPNLGTRYVQFPSSFRTLAHRGANTEFGHMISWSYDRLGVR